MKMKIEMVKNLVRDNILKLERYSSARDEFVAEADVYLDANENPFNWDYNRYPDPYQRQLKVAIEKWRGISSEWLFMGNGSDEVIDLLIRAFCEPQKEQIIVLNPSYGMYKVAADINNVKIKYVDLGDDFELEISQLTNVLEKNDKLLFLCTPNNPSGNCLKPNVISDICDNFSGIVVVDEAYIDFADTRSCLEILADHPNLVVIQTLSKAIGCAGIRIGLGFMHPYIVDILNKIKPPYNISSANQKIALSRLKDQEGIIQHIIAIKSEREIMKNALTKFDFVEKIFPSEANFLLVRVINADALYHHLLTQKIVVRNRSKQFRCQGCLRITIGTPEENIKLLSSLSTYKDIV